MGQSLIGDYLPGDGTIEFYGRVNSALRPDSVVVDLGAGRAAWIDDSATFRRQLRLLKGRAREVVGIDVDEAVLGNPATDRNLVMSAGKVPLPDQCADIVIADYVLEHLLDPTDIEREVHRILKPGGVFCARTPHRWHYVSIGARLIRNASHAKMVALAQPGARSAQDVFPTAYRANSMRSVRRIWATERWEDHSYMYVGEPTYFFGSRVLFRLLDLAHRFLPKPMVGNLFIFMRKHPSSAPARAASAN